MRTDSNDKRLDLLTTFLCHHFVFAVKDKAQVLLQVDELTAVKDELTDQVTSSLW